MEKKTAEVKGKQRHVFTTLCTNDTVAIQVEVSSMIFDPLYSTISLFISVITATGNFIIEFYAVKYRRLQLRVNSCR